MYILKGGISLIHNIEVYILLFFIYSFGGWLLEVFCRLVADRRFINRGFLIGPYCPIYGTGALLMTFLLKRYLSDPFTLFIMAMLICSILEYITSFVMEKLFNARWWDYSHYRFNINGRICLETTIPFGIFGFLICYVMNPFLLNYIEMLPQIALLIIDILLVIVFFIDNIISFKVILSVKKATSEISKTIKDNTEEITRRVKEALKEKSYIAKRLINAFPSFESVKLKIKERISNKE